MCLTINLTIASFPTDSLGDIQNRRKSMEKIVNQSSLAPYFRLLNNN
jgi:hypothetical protein